ncbi:DNA ligase D OS=Lysinibacillus sphaericus OX=1421 GN=LS41612_12740 PE=4 SV=1 [Lysinibacillus sphaericus]
MGLVATPLHWNEVNDKLSPGQFTIPTVIERIKRVGNPLIHFQAIGEEQDFQAVLQHLNNQ